MSDIITSWVEGEVFTQCVSVSLYDEDTGITTFGIDGPNLSDTNKDIFVQVFDAESGALTPLISKSRVSGASTTGVSVVEDDDSYTKILIDWKYSDYPAYPAPGFNSDGKRSRRCELRIMYKQTTADKKTVYPYRDPATGKMVHFYIDLLQNPVVTS